MGPTPFWYEFSRVQPPFQMLIGSLIFILWLILVTSLTWARGENTIYGSHFKKGKQLSQMKGLINVHQDVNAASIILLATTMVDIQERLDPRENKFNSLSSPKIRADISDLLTTYQIPPHVFTPGLHNLIQILSDPTINIVQSVYTQPQHLRTYKKSSMDILRHLRRPTSSPQNYWLMPDGLSHLRKMAQELDDDFTTSNPTPTAADSTTTQPQSDTTADSVQGGTTITTVSPSTTRRSNPLNFLDSMSGSYNNRRYRRGILNNSLVKKIKNTLKKQMPKFSSVVKVIYNNNARLIHQASAYFKPKMQELSLSPHSIKDYYSLAVGHIKGYCNALRSNVTNPHTMEEALISFFNNSAKVTKLGSILNHGLEQLHGIVHRKAMTYLPRQLLKAFSRKLSNHIQEQQNDQVSNYHPLDISELDPTQLQNVPYTIAMDSSTLTHKILYHIPLTSHKTFTSYDYKDGPIEHLYKNHFFDVDYNPYCSVFLQHSDTPSLSRTVVNDYDVDRQCLDIDKPYCLMEKIPDRQDQCLTHLFNDQPSYDYCPGRIIPTEPKPFHTKTNTYQFFTNESMTIVVVCSDGDRVLPETPPYSHVTLTLNDTCTRAHTKGFSFTYNPDIENSPRGDDYDPILGTSLLKPLIPYFNHLIKNLDLKSFDLHNPIVLTWWDRNFELVVIVSSASIPLFILLSCIGYCIVRQHRPTPASPVARPPTYEMSTRRCRKQSEGDSEQLMYQYDKNNA